MRTVKEISKLTGISVRTLHYYDEIGLLRPTSLTEAGYRLYDDKALEALRQILFFREFDMPLKEIKAILESPGFDKEAVLKGQRAMLERKRDRIGRLIASIDDILKGDERMNFEVFNKEDIEEIFGSIVNNMTEDSQKLLMKQYGSMEAYEKHFKEEALGEQAQKNWAKVVEWYGSKEDAKEAAANPGGAEVMAAYSRRFQGILERLVAKKGTDVHTFEVKELVGELDFVAKQLFRLKDPSALLLDLADSYEKEPKMREAQDARYGEGATAYINQAVKAFYKK